MLCGDGGADVNNGVPTLVVADKSVRTNFARRTAPSRFSSPAPCSSMLNFASGWAVYIKIILIRFGVRVGLASNSTATAPATMGDETEVPLSRIFVPPTSKVGFSRASALYGAAAPMILLPGATRSGLIKLS